MNESNLLATRGPLPTVFLLVAILLMIALHLFASVVQLFPFPWRLFGVVPVVAGLVLNVWADQLFKRGGTAVNPFEPSVSLVLKGPFLFTRNPMYLGMVLVLAGIAVGLGSATPWLAIPLFVWQVTERFIVPEEHKLEAAFGQQYLEYMAKVRRWF
jgi:protein-S-isoprenylcysteine O-methyltransferase Ste14